MKTLVLASANPGKLRELRSLLAPLGTGVVSLDELGLAQADEPHTTFVENALAKARQASAATALPALADDSGLCVEALGGAPGVHSAYYAGHDGSREQRDARNNARLLDELSTEENRRAHYYCVLALLRNADDPEPIIAEGRWAGEIARAPRGGGGFGYDPLFVLPGRGITSAELEQAEKNRISHRGIALARLVERLGTAAQ